MQEGAVEGNQKRNLESLEAGVHTANQLGDCQFDRAGRLENLIVHRLGGGVAVEIQFVANAAVSWPGWNVLPPINL